MEIKLKEKFLLLAIEDTKGGSEKGSQLFGLGFAASILLEMIMEDILELNSGKLHMRRLKVLQDPVHRDIAKKLAAKKRDKPLKFWISTINARSGKYKKIVLNTLVDNQILKRKEKRFLGIRYFKYPTLNPKPENIFRKELLASLDNPRNASESDIALLAILNATKFLAILIPNKKDQKLASKRIKDICEGSDFGKAIKSAVDEMTAALITTVVVTGAVS